MKKALIILAVVIVAGAGFMLTREDKDADNNQTTNTSNTSPQPEPSATTPPPVESTDVESKTITYTDDGFSPNTLTVNSGDTLTIRNTSSDSLQFDSDPHPQHTANPELNVDLVESGESKTFKVTAKGSHGYHNHLRSEHTGKITVE